MIIKNFIQSGSIIVSTGFRYPLVEYKVSFLFLFCLLQRQCERERERDLYLLTHSANGCNKWDWVGLKSRARGQELHQDLLCGYSGPSSWPSFTAFPGTLTGSRNKRRNSCDKSQCHMRCQCAKQQLNLVGHNISPIVPFLVKIHTMFKQWCNVCVYIPLVYNQMKWYPKLMWNPSIKCELEAIYIHLYIDPNMLT